MEFETEEEAKKEQILEKKTDEKKAEERKVKEARKAAQKNPIDALRYE